MGYCKQPTLGDVNTDHLITSGIATAGGIATSLMPAEMALGPIGWAVAGITALASLFGLSSFGYDPKKLNDTQYTEAVQLALHQLWYQLTGEDLGGVQTPCNPGDCGKDHVAIFTTSQYPNVPDGAAGAANVDPAVILQQAQSLVQQGLSKLVRSQSLQDYKNNTNYMLGLFQQVADSRAQAATSVDGAITSVTTALQGINWSSPWVWGALGLAAWKLL